jgi:hypothetical protein
MNKSIKHKKKMKLIYKKAFSKEYLLYKKHFPHCANKLIYRNIDRLKVVRLWKKVRYILSKERYKDYILIYVISKQNGYEYHKGTYGYEKVKLIEKYGFKL